MSSKVESSFAKELRREGSFVELNSQCKAALSLNVVAGILRTSKAVGFSKLMLLLCAPQIVPSNRREA
jgi:hypothetical protein